MLNSIAHHPKLLHFGDSMSDTQGNHSVASPVEHEVTVTLDDMWNEATREISSLRPGRSVRHGMLVLGPCSSVVFFIWIRGFTCDTNVDATME
jgi:hypothetical protein